MNKHTKLAIFIAPFLLIGGYIAADYYAENKAKQKNLFQLKLQGKCDLSKQACLINNEQLSLEISHHQGISHISANHPVETIAFSVLDQQEHETTYKMQATLDQQHWQAKTTVGTLLQTHHQLKFRVIAMVNKAYYFSEFYSSKD